MKKSSTVWIRAVFFSFGIAGIFFLGSEIAIELLLDNPAECPEMLLPTLRRYHEYHDRDTFQFDQDRTHFDPDLFYSLNPGHFVFNNREFETTFEVNSVGFRDDEASLIQPQIVVLGDSYTMGWGVDQDQTFSALIEKELGKIVLNTGVSSYGTAREIASLARVDATALDILVIQYSPNDLMENQSYFANDHSLRISGENIFEEACRSNKERTAGFPFKHSILMLQLIGQRLRGEHPARTASDTGAASEIGAAAAFLDIVGRSEHVPRHTRIIVFALEAEKADSGFIDLVASRLERDFGSSLHDRMSFVDLSGLLDHRHRFILDPHLNADGHRVVADQIIKHIDRLERTTGLKEWYYPSGVRSISCEYVDGLKEGRFIAYWPNGEVSRTSWFERGSKTGLEVDFGPDGRKTAERNFKNDRIHGWSTTFDAAGATIERSYYEDGIVIDRNSESSDRTPAKPSIDQ